jgi:hypothetical protein
MKADTGAGRVATPREQDEAVTQRLVRERIDGRRRLLGQTPRRVIASSEATLERMEAEPDTVIALSAEQARQLGEIEAAALRRPAPPVGDGDITAPRPGPGRA